MGTQTRHTTLKKKVIEKMEPKQVSFKICLLDNEKCQLEVRRFLVPQDCSTSLLYLKEKIRTAFGARLHGNFKISWLDQDQDQVIIDADEDLMIALNDQSGPLFKINVILDVQGETRSGEAHPGVICDGCQGPVVGPRYKCLECLDYDLCSSCEKQGTHPNHNMIRITNPDSNAFPRRFAHMMNKMHKRFKEHAKRENQESRESRNPRESCRRPGFRGFFEGQSFGNFAEFCPGPMGPCQMPTGQKAGTGEAPNGLNDLFNIGEAVKTALNAFGVDVDIEVNPETTSEKKRGEKEQEQETDCKQTEKSKETNHSDDSKTSKDIKDYKTSEESMNSQEVRDFKDSKVSEESMKAQEAKDSKDLKDSEHSKPDDLGAASLGAINKKPSEDKIKENEEWTILDDKSSNATEPLYPTLGSLNPKVQIAVQAMENMGFNNQGGWLTDLLERNDANIGKVLDLLAPAKQA